MKLRNSGIAWSIDLVYLMKDGKTSHNPKSGEPRTRVRILDLPMLRKSKTPLGMYKGVEKIFMPHNELITIDSILINACKSLIPDNDVFRAWLKENGEELVHIDESINHEYIADCFKKSLQNSMDSDQSNLQWHSIKHMHKDDWLALVDLALNGIKAASSGNKYTQIAIGMAIKAAFTQHYSEIWFREDPVTNKAVERTDIQRFALLSMQASCNLTDDQEWIQAWTSYFFNSVEIAKPNSLEADKSNSEKN